MYASLYLPTTLYPCIKQVRTVVCTWPVLIWPPKVTHWVRSEWPETTIDTDHFKLIQAPNHVKRQSTAALPRAKSYKDTDIVNILSTAILITLMSKNQYQLVCKGNHIHTAKIPLHRTGNPKYNLRNMNHRAPMCIFFCM